jgi:FKBP-type peptidyl-prolyl cis-trans isomerase
LRYVKHLEDGTGDKCPKGAQCEMHYHGTLADGTVFDSSV